MSRERGDPTRIGGHLDRIADLAPAADGLEDLVDSPPRGIDDDVAAALAGGAHAPDWRDRLWQDAIPSRFQWARLDDFDGAAHDTIAGWASDPRGRNLILTGPVGTGKSHAAVAACRPAFFDHSREVRFCPVVELLDQLRPGGPEGVWDDLVGVDRLIIDDLGSEKVSDWTSERVFALINRRWLEELPTIVTTNLDPPQFAAVIGAPVYSRLTGGAVAVQLSGEDRRRKGPTGTAR